MNTLNPSAASRQMREWRAGSLVRTLKSHGLSVWRALERHGQRRVARELVLTAERIEANNPELAAQLRATARGPYNP